MLKYLKLSSGNLIFFRNLSRYLYQYRMHHTFLNILKMIRDQDMFELQNQKSNTTNEFVQEPILTIHKTRYFSPYCWKGLEIFGSINTSGFLGHGKQIQTIILTYLQDFLNKETHILLLKPNGTQRFRFGSFLYSIAKIPWTLLYHGAVTRLLDSYSDGVMLRR